MRWFFGLSLLWLCLFFPLSAQAQIIVTEVYPQPGSGETEWVELYNDSTQSADLTGWVLKDLLTSPKTIFTFAEVVPPQTFLVATISGQLNNAGDGVSLYDAGSLLIDEMTYSSSEVGSSWQKSPGELNFFQGSPTKGLLAPEPSPSPLPSPSPSIESSPSPSPTPNQVDLAGLRLLRASICPKQGTEWLEWSNLGSTQFVATAYIKDAQANSLTLSLNLAPHSTQKTQLSRHIFNNGGDEIFIYFQNELWQHYEFVGCESFDSLFVFNSTSTWAELEVGVENTKFDQPLVAPTSTAPSIFKSPTTPKLAFSYPSSVLSLTNSPATPDGTAAGAISFASTSKVSSPPPWRWPALFLIGGGILWISLGIIELYGEQSSTDFSVA